MTGPQPRRRPLLASEIVTGTGRWGQLGPRADGQPGWLGGERRQRPPTYQGPPATLPAYLQTGERPRPWSRPRAFTPPMAHVALDVVLAGIAVTSAHRGRAQFLPTPAHSRTGAKEPPRLTLDPLCGYAHVRLPGCLACQVAHATACDTGKQAAPARVVCDWTGGGAPHRILAVTAWSSYAVGLRVPTSTVTSDPAGKRWPAEGCWATTRWTCPESLTCVGTTWVPSCAWASTSAACWRCRPTTSGTIRWPGPTACLVVVVCRVVAGGDAVPVRVVDGDAVWPVPGWWSTGWSWSPGSRSRPAPRRGW